MMINLVSNSQTFLRCDLIRAHLGHVYRLLSDRRIQMISEVVHRL